MGGFEEKPKNNALKIVDTARETVLKKRFGDIIPSITTDPFKSKIHTILDSAPKTEGAFSGIFGPQQIKHYILEADNSTFSATIEKQESGLITIIIKGYVDIDKGGPYAEGGISKNSVDMGYLVIYPDRPGIWINTFNNKAQYDDLNQQFIGECNSQGVTDSKEIQNLEKMKIGMRPGYDLSLEMRELRENEEDKLLLIMANTIVDEKYEKDITVIQKLNS